MNRDGLEPDGVLDAGRGALARSKLMRCLDCCVSSARLGAEMVLLLVHR